MKNCVNHPEREALSICHGCGKDYCKLCLDEGKEFYYCKNPGCQILLKTDLSAEMFPANVICPNCKNELELSEDERTNRKIHCPECEAVIDFNVDPPKILNRDSYVELLSSFNQGDIALIKSLFENSNVDFYTFGENFLSIDPLIQPAKFYVNESQVEEAKELLKDFEFHIWGASDNQ